MRITPNPFHLGSIPPLPVISQPPVVTTEVLGWTFTRPASSRFDVDNYRGYWALHLAQTADLVYDEKPYVYDRLAAAGYTSIEWVDLGSTHTVGYLNAA